MARSDLSTAFEHQLIARLHQVFGGQDWIVAGEVAQGIGRGALALRALGADRILCIANRTGVGELPDDVRFILSDDCRVGEDANMVERMHDSNRELHDLPQWVLDEVDEWDPDRQAKVVVSFTVDDGLVAERPTFGARRPEWAELEDKIAIRTLWSAAGIETAPDQVVDLDDIDASVAAHDRLATALGTVWAVDNEQGWHGGGTGTYWVHSASRARELAVNLASRHRRARIQPFLQGVPCSIHGMVLAEATLAFRPCEMIMLLDEKNHEFVYSRTATFWDPSVDDRESMRETARRVGDTLRDAVDFRGVFTLDGVLTADGFLPTEVNPRFGAALPRRLPLADGSSLDLFVLHLAATAGHLDDLGALELERMIVNLLDANRAGGAFIFTSMAPPDGGKTAAIATDFSVVAAKDPDALATVSWGPDPSGGLIFVTFTDQMPTGPPVASQLPAMRSALSKHWNLDLADLTPAATSI